MKKNAKIRWLFADLIELPYSGISQDRSPLLHFTRPYHCLSLSRTISRLLLILPSLSYRSDSNGPEKYEYSLEEPKRLVSIVNFRRISMS